MSCLREALRELKMVQRVAPPAPEVDPKLKRDEVYRSGYITGFQAAIRDSIDIVQETCEVEEDDE